MKNVMILLCAAEIVMMSVAGAAAEPVTIQLSHDLPAETPQHLGSLKFKEIVESKSGGNITVEIFPEGELGSDIETVKLLQMDIIQASLVPTAKLSSFAPTLQMVDLPFLFPSKEACYCTLDSDVGETLLSGLEEIGLQGVAFWESGFKQFTANKAIRQPEDYEGLKIRVMQSPILIEQFTAMGADAVTISFSEVYNALQQDVVDGQENPLVSITKMKFYDVQSHMTLSYHGYLAYAFLFSKMFWDGLEPDQQRMIKEAALEAARYEREQTSEMEDGFLKTIMNSGTEIIRLTLEERSAFEGATRTVHNKFADSIGKDTLKLVYAKIKECSN